MVEDQLRVRDIVDERVLTAMARVPRELFVPSGERPRAFADAALPIGHGQTISQPYMVARICEILGLTGRERVLDVGTGSGYQAAVLAELAAEVAHDRADSRARRAGPGEPRRGRLRAGRVHVGDGSLGLPEHAPFDAIAVAAAAPRLPQQLYEQLEPRGRLAVPVGGRCGPAAGADRAQPRGACGRALGPVPVRAARRPGRLREMKRAASSSAASVQGVFFRTETRDRARSLGVAGWIATFPTEPSRPPSRATTSAWIDGRVVPARPVGRQRRTRRGGVGRARGRGGLRPSG